MQQCGQLPPQGQRQLRPPNQLLGFEQLLLVNKALQGSASLHHKAAHQQGTPLALSVPFQLSKCKPVVQSILGYISLGQCARSLVETCANVSKM